MRTRLRSGATFFGGVLGYPLDQISEEVAFIAYHFHWSHEEIMQLEHDDRRDWVTRISSINRKINEVQD